MKASDSDRDIIKHQVLSSIKKIESKNEFDCDNIVILDVSGLENTEIVVDILKEINYFNGNEENIRKSLYKVDYVFIRKVGDEVYYVSIGIGNSLSDYSLENYFHIDNMVNN
jgi:hypothetical protein